MIFGTEKRKYIVSGDKSHEELYENIENAPVQSKGRKKFWKFNKNFKPDPLYYVKKKNEK